MVGGKTNDDIFAANVRSKEKKKQVKKKKKKHTCSSIFDQPDCLQSRRGRTRKAQHTQTHTQEERLERRRGGDIGEEVYTPE